MAIRRCPYCKAIIDEEDKYCNNCGTQLLFPEDEFVEEEIPGDKIIDEEAEEEEGEEDLGEEKELEEELEEEEEFIEAEEEEDHEEEEYEEKEEEEEEQAEEERLQEEAEDAMEEEETGRLEATGDGAGTSEILEEETSEKIQAEEEEEEEQRPVLEGGTHEEVAVTERAALEPLGLGERKETRGEEAEIQELAKESEAAVPAELAQQRSAREEFDKKYEVKIEKDQLVFKTKDLESLTKTVDEGKKEIEELIEAHARMEKEEPTSDTKETLPPWVSQIKEKPDLIESEPEEAGKKPETGLKGWTVDSGIGIPEKITQAGLPFQDTGVQEIGKVGKEHVDVEEQAEETTDRGEEVREPAALSLRLKAKFVDWVFVTALWLISLWFSAQVVGVSFFRLLFGSPAPVLAFYLILLFLYFFLFLYFLGETLGDHYFLEGD